MKNTLVRITLAALAVVLLGSCEKIYQRIDALEERIDGIETEKIASIDSQIASINSSIADLGTIRSNITSLRSQVDDHSTDIFNLEEADRALNDRILNLEDYLDDVLPTYAEKDWVKATFSTLAQYEATCDTIAKIDARIGKLDERLSKEIKACADSMKKWVNVQFEAYYTAAEMDAALEYMQAEIDSAKVSGKITDERVDSLAKELTTLKTAVDTAKANIRKEYRAAIDTAITHSEGRLTKALTDAITKANDDITALTTRVSNLEVSVATLTGRVTALEGMIQSVTIVPAYSDGSVKVDDKDSLYIDFIVSPASAIANLAKGNVTVLVNKVKTKAFAGVDSIKIGAGDLFEKDAAKGAVSVRVSVADKIPAITDSTITVAVNVKNGVSNYTTEFVPVTILPPLYLPGEFTVNADGKKVKFSRGNLYAKKNGNKWTWRLYDEQYEFLAADMAVRSSEEHTRSVDANETEIALFTWGYSETTSLLPTGDAHISDYSTLVYDKSSSEGGNDWGVAFCESNGITIGKWRTLSREEWDYVFITRTVNGGTAAYSLNITYSGVTGVVLYPDNYTGTPLSGEVATLPEGVVFLPAAGNRQNAEVFNVGENGIYWSSSAEDENDVFGLGFSIYNIEWSKRSSARQGNSVRLVTEVK